MTRSISLAAPTDHDRRLGYFFGFVGVASFSLTLPATRSAVASLDPAFVGLVVQRVPWPGWAVLPRLAVVAAGVVIGFPLFSAWALRHVPAAHAAVVIGLLPLATAVAGTGDRVHRARPSRRLTGRVGYTCAARRT